MKSNNNVEVLLYTSAPNSGLEEKELVDWLTTTAQATIVKQQEMTEKMVLSILKDSPAIYMS